MSILALGAEPLGDGGINHVRNNYGALREPGRSSTV
jgi:hypothetical protein